MMNDKEKKGWGRKKVMLLSLTVLMGCTLPLTTSGRSFSTPEEVVEAYIDAFARLDLKALTDCYAINEEAENYRLDLMVERQSGYPPSHTLQNGIVYRDTPEAVQLNRGLWTDLVIKQIRYQYLILTDAKVNELYKGIEYDQNTDSAEQILSEAIPENEEVLSQLTFRGEYVDPEILTKGKYSLEINKKKH